MFTGLIDHRGKIEKIIPLKTGIKLIIQTQFTDLFLGESISVDGACLTVVDLEKNLFSVELSPETLNLTIAKNYSPGSYVNLERALKLQDRLGGHFVTGHVDQIATIIDIIPQDKFYHYIIGNIHPEYHRYLIPKGSITMNGVSLTINKINGGTFDVMLIPHTLQLTNLSTLTINSTVNIEFDYLAKLVTHQLRATTYESI